MIYKSFQDKQLSALGLGCMRLPVVDGSNGQIDEAAVAQMVASAMAQGVNYYDTAWGYHEGNSEWVMGRVLSAYPRHSYYLASKFPGYDRNNLANKEAVFEKQLEKCQTDHFDFYLLHSITDSNADGYLDPQYGLMDYLRAQKWQGRIWHIGISVHCSLDTLRRLLDAWGEAVEFCQIQLNWLDWTLQDAKAKVELLNERGIPVWVMEPVRGGRLVQLSDENVQKLAALRPTETVPGWAFRFLQSVPGVTMVLSGMSNLEQLQQNIATFAAQQPLNQAEAAALQDIAQGLLANKTQLCTQCRYCVAYCPQGLDIPALLKAYNNHALSGAKIAMPAAIAALDEDKRPAACVGCRSCEQVCPQGIQIAATMAAFADCMR